jgi:hypothetical protein
MTPSRLADVHRRPQSVGEPAARVVGEQERRQGQPVGQQAGDPAEAVGGRVQRQPGEDPAQQHHAVGRQPDGQARPGERQTEARPQRAADGGAPAGLAGRRRARDGEPRRERRRLDRSHGAGR